MGPEADAQIAPVGLKAKFSIRPGKAVQVMRGCKFGLAIDPTVAFEHFKPSPAGILQSRIAELARSHGKARMLCAHSRGEPADHVVIGSRLAGWLDQFWPELNVLVTSTLVDVVMLEKS